MHELEKNNSCIRGIYPKFTLLKFKNEKRLHYRRNALCYWKF